MRLPMPRFATRSLVLVLLVVVAGCASHPAPRVTRLGNGVFQSPSPRETEAYYRNFGAPMRYLDPKLKPGPDTEVTYRCD